MKLVAGVMLALILLIALGVLVGTLLRMRREELEEIQPMSQLYTQDDWEPCTCGHPFHVHVHHRAGKDCGICGRDVCDHFDAKAPQPWWREMLKNFQRGWRHG
jgi:hypothetical protein